MRPHEFDRKTKIEILKRDIFSCVLCGKHKTETKKGFLEIHHKVKIAWWEKNKNSTDIDDDLFMSSKYNGICLCQDCHHTLHSQETSSYYWRMLIQVLEEYCLI